MREEIVTIMKTQTLYTRTFTTIIAFACVASLSIRLANAQEDPDLLEENKSAVVKSFCGEDGKLATCIELSASECETTMRPFVDTCYEKTEEAKGSLKRPEAAFHSCFWAEFNKKYSRKIKLTEECYAVAKEAFPLQPIPPHLEGQTELLNPPGTNNDNRGELGY
jgi:hypothetical protein